MPSEEDLKVHLNNCLVNAEKKTEKCFECDKCMKKLKAMKWSIKVFVIMNATFVTNVLDQPHN